MTTKYFRIAKVAVEYFYILADDEEEAKRQAAKEYGIPVVQPAMFAEELPAEVWLKALDGVPDENGGHYNGDGTAWFYNDEYHEYYRLNVEKRMWLPIEESWPENWLDEDEAALHDTWPTRFGQAEDLYNHQESDIDSGFDQDKGDSWIDFMETNGR